MALLRLLAEMSTRDIFWGKGGRCVGRTTLPPSCVDCLEALEPSTSWSPKQGRVQACQWIDLFAFPLVFIKQYTQQGTQLSVINAFTI